MRVGTIWPRRHVCCVRLSMPIASYVRWERVVNVKLVFISMLLIRGVTLVAVRPMSMLVLGPTPARCVRSAVATC